MNINQRLSQRPQGAGQAAPTFKAEATALEAAYATIRVNFGRASALFQAGDDVEGAKALSSTMTDYEALEARRAKLIAQGVEAHGQALSLSQALLAAGDIAGAEEAQALAEEIENVLGGVHQAAEAAVAAADAAREEGVLLAFRMRRDHAEERQEAYEAIKNKVDNIRTGEATDWGWVKDAAIAGGVLLVGSVIVATVGSLIR